MPKLFKEFSSPSLGDWKKLTEKELKGANINNLDQWLESDGFKPKPAYFKEETEKLPMYGQTIRPLRFNQNNNDWLICADVMVGDIGQTNTEILHKLALGANALNVDLNGIDLASDEISELFHDVIIDAVAISFCNAYNPVRFQSDYFKWAKDRSVKGRFWFSELNADLASSLIADNNQGAFGSIGLDCSHFYIKGANISQQLGASLAWGNELLNGLRERSVSFEKVSENIGFSMAIGSSFLPEIAKFRLMRFLWARVMQQHGAATKRWRISVHARSGERHLSSMDTPVNILRENAQAMSAVMGSVDSLAIHPFRADEPELADRIAINTQHLMKDEARLDRVIDPAAGSYYIEHLSDIIGKSAWDFFLEIEHQGGYHACSTSGFLDEAFAKSDSAYYDEVEKLERVLVGTNKFPSPYEESNDKVEEDEA